MRPAQGPGRSGVCPLAGFTSCTLPAWPRKGMSLGPSLLNSLPLFPLNPASCCREQDATCVSLLRQAARHSHHGSECLTLPICPMGTLTLIHGNSKGNSEKKFSRVFSSCRQARSPPEVKAPGDKIQQVYTQQPQKRADATTTNTVSILPFFWALGHLIYFTNPVRQIRLFLLYSGRHQDSEGAVSQLAKKCPR